MTAAIHLWLTKYSLTPKCWRIEKTQSHKVLGCGCTSYTPEGEGAPSCQLCHGSGLILAEPEKPHAFVGNETHCQHEADGRRCLEGKAMWLHTVAAQHEHAAKVTS